MDVLRLGDMPLVVNKPSGLLSVAYVKRELVRVVCLVISITYCAYHAISGSVIGVVEIPDISGAIK